MSFVGVLYCVSVVIVQNYKYLFLWHGESLGLESLQEQNLHLAVARVHRPTVLMRHGEPHGFGIH